VRVAVVDIGTNSTRLLVADVDAPAAGPADADADADGNTDPGADRDAHAGRITEIDRRTVVTRLGQDVDATGRLADEAVERVVAVLAEYRAAIDDLGATRAVAVLTSAVRDADNGPEFLNRVRDEFGLDARTISGAEEARLTFLGATSERPADAPEPVVVIDIGGGSTEFVVGAGGELRFHVSVQAGAVRQTERHVRSDPPAAAEVEAMRAEARSIIASEVPADVRETTRAAIAVAGTATSLGAIDQKLDPYDPAKVHGYDLTLERAQKALAMLAAMTDAQRREVPGLEPARAPAIVAGATILVEALEAFNLDSTAVSEHDILRGAALEAVHREP
jgi:exopolyphosphatase/guanosine-5'-triphosphate,3'-diphosphate pyrophosphatase